MSRPELGYDQRVKCLKCDATLLDVEVGGVRVDQCSNCSGVWFDSGELERVLAQQDVSVLANVADNNASHDMMRASCPRCGGAGKLVRVVSPQRSDVHIDTCSVCGGQWLDGGELQMLRGKGFWSRLAGLFR